MYFRGTGGVLALAVSNAEVMKEVQRIHNLSYGDNDLSLYRRLQMIVQGQP